MSLEKIFDEKRPCLHPEHSPPSHIVLDPGRYKYTCPCCGEEKFFSVGGFTMEETSAGDLYLGKFSYDNDSIASLYGNR